MQGPSARIAAQAKLNLHLVVLAREESGFHSIETIFHRVDLADQLTVTATDGERTIDVDGADVGPAESNLAFRAAVAYAERAGWPSGFRIDLAKNIPVGAGLGGGSSDAAAVLRCLNFLSPQPIPKSELLGIAAGLGSDVPFLTSDAVMALGWGRGERLFECTLLPPKHVLLITPSFGVSTADAYRWLGEARISSSVPEPVVLDDLSLSSWSSVARFCRNDFERVIGARYPEVVEHIGFLRHSRALLARMTGSGSTVFGIFDAPFDVASFPTEQRGQPRVTTTAIDVVQPVRVG